MRLDAYPARRRECSCLAAVERFRSPQRQLTGSNGLSCLQAREYSLAPGCFNACSFSGVSVPLTGQLRLTPDGARPALTSDLTYELRQ
jgi:hypothetical protein